MSDIECEWNLVIKIGASTQQRMIERLEEVLSIMRKANFARHGGGTINCYHSVSGPPVRPLSENELIKIRKLIEE